MKWLLLILSFNVNALEVLKPSFGNKIELRIIRVETDSFNTYLLTTSNLTELSLVCSDNAFYDKNPKAFIEFRNYYREVAGNFIIQNNKACLELGHFIETSQSGISAETPFLMTLNRKKMELEKIVYPHLDPFTMGEEKSPTKKLIKVPLL